jgi:hypothetical protein
MQETVTDFIRSNMKHLFTIVFSLIVISASFAQTLDFKFYDSNGREFSSATFSKEIITRADIDFHGGIILLETPSLDDTLFKKQDQILDFLDAESLRLIYITACPTEEYKHGYHTTVETANALINTDKRFRIRLLDNNAGVIYESLEVISKEIINQVYTSDQKYLSAFLLEDELKPDNILSQYKQFDFSGLLSHTENYQIFGVIGADNQRIKVKLTSISKNPENAGNQIQYDDIQSFSDKYMNNAYIGTWRSYSTGKEKLCNWADHRIPLANQDFDVGEGEFLPGEKYYNKGWEAYHQAWQLGNMEAKSEELREWWK